MKFLEGREVGCFHPEKVFHGSGHVVAFPHLGSGCHGLFEGLLVFLLMLRKADSDKCDEAGADRFAIDDGSISPDNVSALEILDPAQASGRRQADLIGKVGIADPAISLEYSQYSTVDLIDFRHSL